MNKDVLFGFIFWIISLLFVFLASIYAGRLFGEQAFINKYYNQEFRIISKTSRVDGQYSYDVIVPGEKAYSFNLSTKENLELNGTISLRSAQ